MKAAYWTQFGAMAIPLGVALIALSPNLRTVAVGLIIIGFISFITGWGYTIRDERRNDAKEEEAKQRRQSDEKQRQREHRENLIMLVELANRRGMSTPRLIRLIERLKREGEEEDEL